jgi:catechol-2,3-dioxygenase
MPNITRLNHAVLYVSDLDRSVEFYKKAFGFEEISRLGGQMAFLRAAGSENHHDLGLMSVGADAPAPPRGATGLYHLAWQLETVEDLAQAAAAPPASITSPGSSKRSRSWQTPPRRSPGSMRSSA